MRRRRCRARGRRSWRRPWRRLDGDDRTGRCRRGGALCLGLDRGRRRLVRRLRPVDITAGAERCGRDGEQSEPSGAERPCQRPAFRFIPRLGGDVAEPLVGAGIRSERALFAPGQFLFDAFDRGFERRLFRRDLCHRLWRPKSPQSLRQYAPGAIVEIAAPLRIARLRGGHRAQQSRIVIDHGSAAAYAADLSQEFGMCAFVASSVCASTATSQYCARGRHSSR